MKKHDKQTSGNPVDTEKVRPQAVGDYKERVKSLGRFAIIFFAVMVVGTVTITLMLLTR